MHIRQPNTPTRQEAKELIKIYKPDSNFRIKSSTKEVSEALLIKKKKLNKIIKKSFKRSSYY